MGRGRGTFSEIVDAARSGDDAAWAVLYHGVADQLLGYLRAQGAPEPEDALGEVFLQLARNLRRFRGDEDAFRTWAFQIAHHRVVDQWRGRDRDRRELVDATTLEALAPGDERAHDPTPSSVTELVGSLTPEQRDVVLLRVVADLSIHEVARIVDKSPDAVKQLQRRGLDTLRRRLGSTADGDVTPLAVGRATS